MPLTSTGCWPTSSRTKTSLATSCEAHHHPPGATKVDHTASRAGRGGCHLRRARVRKEGAAEAAARQAARSPRGVRRAPPGFRGLSADPGSRRQHRRHDAGRHPARGRLRVHRPIPGPRGPLQVRHGSGVRSRAQARRGSAGAKGEGEREGERGGEGKEAGGPRPGPRLRRDRLPPYRTASIRATWSSSPSRLARRSLRTS